MSDHQGNYPNNHPDKEQQEIDQLLRQHLSAQNEKNGKNGKNGKKANLPSNFAYQVMLGIRRRKMAGKLIQARRQALWESSVITLFALPICIGLFVMTAGYLETSLDVGLLDGGFVPAFLLLGGLFLLDAKWLSTSRPTSRAEAQASQTPRP